jgi:hypothetical protein
LNSQYSLPSQKNNNKKKTKRKEEKEMVEKQVKLGVGDIAQL